MNEHSDDTVKEEPAHKHSAVVKGHKLKRIILSVIGGIVILAGLFFLYAYVSTPASIRKPAFQHYHFRMQVLVDGKAVNFAEKEFQTDVTKDVCSANLTNQPIHFHDDKDQMVHIHWDGITGGQVLKYYGWNYIGGQHGTLGFRFDQLPKLVNVPIHGNTLPTASEGDNFYVYTGDEQGYKQQKWEDFLHKDFESFFGKKSNLPTNNGDESTSLIDKLFPKAYAHGTEEHGAAASSVSDQELQKINNLLGNVVIFVQKEKPTDKQVKDRFNKLAPLSLSSCAG